MRNMKKNPKKLALNLSSTLTSSTTQDNMHHKNNDLYRQGPACILPNLYLGAYYNALNATQLTQHKINCIINVASEITYTNTMVEEYHHVPWAHSQSNLAHTEFAHAIAMIESAHSKQHHVLVHCQQGIERSAALVIAYLLFTTSSLARQPWSLDHALKYVQEKAPGIRPNMELLYQLRAYEKRLTTTKHNIQTRTKRSESITTTSRLLMNNNKTRHRRATSFNWSPPAVITKDNKQLLATVSLIVVLVALYHQGKLLLLLQGEENGLLLNSFNNPVYPVY